MAALGDAITYPMEREDWIKNVLIGGVLVLFGFLLVPMFLVYGYVVRAIRDSMEGRPEPPAFGEWGSLLVEGLQAWIIGLIFMIVPLAVGAVTVGGSILAMATGSRSGAAAGMGGLLVGFLLTFVLSLVFGYFAVVAIVNFAREERFGAAFDVGTIKRVGFDRDYAVAWLVSVVVFLVAGAIGGVLNVIPFLGFVVAAFVYYYAAVVAANLWAGGFVEAVGTADVGTADVGTADV